VLLPVTIFLPPFFLPVALSSSCCFQLSRGDYGTSRKGQKTYGSVLGTIFFGGVGSPHIVERQLLAMEKIPKNRKNACKSAKYFPSDPGFSAKTGRI
jgi:hypothetical protein